MEGLEQNAEQQGAEPFIENDSDLIYEGTDTNLNVSLAGSESSHENIQETVNLPVLPSDHDMCEMSSKIEDIEVRKHKKEAKREQRRTQQNHKNMVTEYAELSWCSDWCSSCDFARVTSLSVSSTRGCKHTLSHFTLKCPFTR